MEKFYMELENGKSVEVELTQNPYLDGITKEDTRYVASATDVEGNDYMLYWEIKENWDWEDGGDACDWNNPSKIIEL